MKLYTRTGDTGATGLYGGARLSKADVHISAYGSLDELTTTLGMFIAHMGEDTEEVRFVEEIQRDLYVIMGFLAHAPADFKEFEKKIARFEEKIDTHTNSLPPLKDFILPGGSLTSCWAHMARVSCRRAERIIIRYFQKSKIMDSSTSSVILKYMNRLSDLLFTYARLFNKEGDIISKKP